MTKLLITHSANITAVDDKGKTVLHMALQKDTDPEIVELLCDRDHGVQEHIKQKMQMEKHLYVYQNNLLEE